MENLSVFYDKVTTDLKQLNDMYERTMSDIKEYQELTSTLKIMLDFEKSHSKDDIKMRTNLGEYVFADVTLREKNKVVVKMIGDIYAELTYERGLAFAEGKIVLLEKYIEDYKLSMGKLKAHMDVGLIIKNEMMVQEGIIETV
uniref:Prefoldin subunit 5 n=1 Tax=Rhabditophanes sp. KR3021 TaxID=114890 RepID=A0AC35UA06_9BILA